MHETLYTLIFVKKCNKLLLGYKKRGLGKKKWNGYGGKIEYNESIIDGAIRELFEESNLKVDREDLRFLGIVTYNTLCNKRIVYIFTTDTIGGILKETEEMKPKWFELENIPYGNTWPDLQFWLPLVLKDCYLEANFTYKDNSFEIVDYKVKELDTMPSFCLI